MPIYDEDISAFFSTDDFGVMATYRTSGGGLSYPIVQMFKPYQVITRHGTSVDSQYPYLLVSESDCPDLKQGDIFALQTNFWAVTDVQPNGTGILRAILAKDDVDMDFGESGETNTVTIDMNSVKESYNFGDYN